MKEKSKYSDEEIILLIQKGDLQAFDELYSRYSESLIVYVYNKLGDLEESKDVVQEIFVNIWRDRHNLLVLRSTFGYLFKIATNKSLNIFKKRKIEEKYINSLAEYLDDATVNPEHDSIEEENEQLINAAVNKLPEKMKEVFKLRYYKGLSNIEVASRLNISPHTVATHMKRALKEIRKTTTLIVFITALVNL